jgi:hypothetical protein
MTKTLLHCLLFKHRVILSRIYLRSLNAEIIRLILKFQAR